MRSFGLAACDIAPNVELYNGAGRPLTLEVAKGERPPALARLKPGGSVRISNIYGPDFRITTEGCERRRHLPYMTMNHPWFVPDGEGGEAPDMNYLYPVDVQLQPDFGLYLMPYDAKAVVSARELQRSQAHGYPLRPVSKT